MPTTRGKVEEDEAITHAKYNAYLKRYGEYSGPLDLFGLERMFVELAIEAYVKRDGAELGMWLGTGGIEKIIENADLLKTCGLWEPALFNAYQTIFPGPPIALMRQLFASCDRERLRNVGDVLPGPGPFNIYRGVSGKRNERRINSVSWTGSIDVACCFARLGSRHGRVDPAVYIARVSADDVYCYSNALDQYEFVCNPRYPKRMALSVKDITRLGDACEKKAEARTKQMVNNANSLHNSQGSSLVASTRDTPTKKKSRKDK